MKQKDNEIHRGPPESTPTLAQSNPIVGSDIHLVKDVLSTADQETTEDQDPARRDHKAQKKKRSRLSRALKLVASCATAVAVVATISAPPKPDIPEELPLWPIIGINIHEYIAKNATTVQASLDGKSYRFTALQEGHYLFWGQTELYSFDDPHQTLFLMFNDVNSSFSATLWVRTSLEGAKDWFLSEYKEIRTASGDILYIGCSEAGYYPEDEIPLVDDLETYIRVSEATDDGWGYVQIGNTMYTETNAEWYGGSFVPFSGGRYVIGSITTPSEAGYRDEDLLCERDINGIHWRFYSRTEPYDTDYDGKVDECLIYIIFVPDQEEIAFTQFASVLLEDRGFPSFEDNLLQTLQNSEELRHSLREGLLDIIEYDSSGLKYYHLLEDMPASE